MLSLLNDVKFGVELETCLHMLGQTYFMEKYTTSSLVLKYVMNCAKTKLPELKWDTGDYDSWNIEEDGSLRCKDTRYCMVKGIYTENCSGLIFHPMEFVSPVLKGVEGLKEFALFWFGFFMGNNMVHLVNSTQGLHVNLSHPDLDPMDFARLWVYYEPVIWQLIPERRRKEAEKYAEPVRSMNRNFSIKYGAIHIHGDDETRRIEVRVQEGIFIFSEILTWILLLMHMVVQAILQKDRVYSKFDDQITELENFFEMLGDTKLVTYYNEIYNQNKESDWPSFLYNGKTKDIYSSIYHENLYESVKHEIKDRKNCEDGFIHTKNFRDNFESYLMNEDNNIILKNLELIDFYEDEDMYSVIVYYAARKNVREILEYVLGFSYFFIFSQAVMEYCIRYDDLEYFKKYFYKREKETFQKQYEFVINLGFRLNQKKFVKCIIDIYDPPKADKYYVNHIRDMLEPRDNMTEFAKGYHNIPYDQKIRDPLLYISGFAMGQHIDSVKELYERFDHQVYPHPDILPWAGKDIIKWAVKNVNYPSDDIKNIVKKLIKIQILEDLQACLENIEKSDNYIQEYKEYIDYCCIYGSLEIFEYLCLTVPIQDTSKEIKHLYNIAISDGNIEIVKKLHNLLE